MSDAEAEASSGAGHRFATEVRRLRELRGISQAELARLATACGAPMQQPTVAKIERGGQAVSLDQAVALSMALGVELATLLATANTMMTAEELKLVVAEAEPLIQRLSKELEEVERREGEARRSALVLRARLYALHERQRLATKRLLEIDPDAIFDESGGILRNLPDELFLDALRRTTDQEKAAPLIERVEAVLARQESWRNGEHPEAP